MTTVTASTPNARSRPELPFRPRAFPDLLAHRETRTPRHLGRDARAMYDRLISAREVRDIFRVVGRLAEEHADGAAPMELLGRDGVLRIPNAHCYSASLQGLCDELEATFRSSIAATLFHKPPDSVEEQHFDVADLIVVQLEGDTHWRVYESGAVDPLDDVPRLPFESAAPMLQRLRAAAERKSASAVLIDAVLRPGDLLYIPGGREYEVSTTSSTSTYVTISIQPLTYIDLLIAGIRRFAETDVRARQRIAAESYAAPGSDAHVPEILSAFAASFEAAASLEALSGPWEARLRAKTEFPSCLAQTPPAADLGLDSVLEQVSVERGEVTLTPNSAAIAYGGRKFTMPPVAAPALSFIVGHARFAVRDLPDLNDTNRLGLCARLLRAHVLRVAGAPAAAGEAP